MAGVEQNRYKTNNGVLNICHRPDVQYNSDNVETTINHGRSVKGVFTMLQCMLRWPSFQDFSRLMIICFTQGFS